MDDPVNLHDVWTLTNIGSDIVNKINGDPSADGLKELGLDESLYDRITAHIRNSENVLESMRTWRVSDNVLTARAEYITFVIVIEGILAETGLTGGHLDPDLPGVR